MMPLHPKPTRKIWHQQVASSGATECLIDGNLSAFPYQYLTLTTEAYITRKKLAKQSQACDCHLDELVAEHVDREGGCLEIGILACQPAYSRFAALQSLMRLRGDDEQHPRWTKYLRCLLLAHQIAPAHFSDSEAKVAEALLRIRNQDGDALTIFRTMVSELGQIPNSMLLPPAYINRLLDFCSFRKSCEDRLNWLRTQRRFMSLCNLTTWIKSVPVLRFAPTARAVLDVQIPSVTLWMSWRPGYSRLMDWERGSFSKPQRQRLAHIFDLEGPDMTHMGYPTFKDALPACLDTIQIGERDPTLPQRLLDALDRAQAVGSAAVDLFIHLCVDTPATRSRIAFAMTFIQTADEVCCQGAISLFSALEPRAGFNDPVSALSEALPLMNNYPSLQAAFEDSIVQHVETAMRTAQRDYCVQLTHGMAENLAFKVHDFGAAILEAVWLFDRLDEDFLTMVQKFPTRELLQGIFENIQTAPRSAPAMKDYLAVSLGGQDGDLDQLKAAALKEQQFWVKTNDPERGYVIHAVRNLDGIDDVDFLIACRNQIMIEDIVLLRDLLPLLTRNTNIACVDFLRILGRRQELNCGVHEVWIMLLYKMMERRMNTFLAWSCDNLPPDQWFRWLADLQLMYPPEDNHELCSHMGMTTERWNWWSQLSGTYFDAVKNIEALQAGQGTLKWLYLREVANAEMLLDVVSRQEVLDNHHHAILSYFEPSMLVINNVCDCLAALSQSSPLGQLCIKSVLARHQLPEDQWGKTATQVFILSWLRSSDLHEEDKIALNGLAELMDVLPATHTRGFADAKNRLLGEYRGIIAMAQKLETTRVSLRLRDARRTSGLLARLGIEDSRGVVDPDIPDELLDMVERVGDREYELCFPLTSFRDYNRTTRGIEDGARMVLVRVSFGAKTGFCLHMSPGGSGDAGARHKYWTTDKMEPDDRVCNTGLDPFTYLVGRRLHRLLKAGTSPPSLMALTRHVATTIKSPAKECLICGVPLGTHIWRPTTCELDRCRTELSKAPAAVKLSSFLADPPVVDFLLACVFAAAADTSSLQLLPGCPIEKTSLRAVINSFPALPATGTTPQALLASIRGADNLGAHRELLLAWMCTVFRGCLLSAPPGKGVPLMPGVQQFLLFNSAPELEAAFAARNASASGAGVGGAVFHGTPAPRLWRVLTEGLKNMTDSVFMVHGAASGPGVYLADEPSMSLSYAGALANTWRRSAFAGRTVLLGCELHGHTPQATHAVVDDARVIVRYVFLCPQGFTAPQARHVENAMKMTFAFLRTPT